MADGPRVDARVARARGAAERFAWDQASVDYAAAAAAGPLDAADLERWATAAYLVGAVDDCIAALTEAYEQHQRRREIAPAVRVGFRIVFTLLHRGDLAQGTGWWQRCTEHLAQLPSDSAEAGYFVCLDGYRLAAIEHRFAEAEEVGERAVRIGRRAGEADVLALGLNIWGRSAIRDGRPGDGLPRLDQAMIELMAGRVSPIVSGVVYCSVVEACEELADVRRAREWTQALDRWCAAQGRMVTFSGRCLIHRAALALGEGRWTEAEALAHDACTRLVGAADEASTGRARYVLGEVARLTGADSDAEEHYRAATDWSHDPQPGLALLRLRQGRRRDAATTIGRVLRDTSLPLARATILPAAVDIDLAVGDLTAAVEAAAELTSIADTYDTTALHAAADRAGGQVAAATDDTGALARLRRACAAFRSLPAPYEAARTRLLVATQLERSGDGDTAAIEREGARRTLARLGAKPDLDAMSEASAAGGHGLSKREVEVLGLLATGVTNQAIADEPCIAVRTVDRHVENIFHKLDVSTRTAATAAAYERQLL